MLTNQEQKETRENTKDHHPTEIEVTLSNFNIAQAQIREEESADPPKLPRPDVINAHKKMMQMALSDTGWWCHGVMAIEVWVYSKEGRLEMIEGNSWVDPVYLNNESADIKKAFRALHDASSLDFQRFSKKSYAPGVGLPGALWAETFGKSYALASGSFSSPGTCEKNYIPRIDWRNIPALSQDPDQPYDPRMFALSRAGLQQAAGIPFNVRGTQGIVIFMTRQSAKLDKLSSRLNEEHLITASEHIGSIQALFQSREAQAKERSIRVKKHFHRIRRKICCFLAFYVHKDPEDSSVEEQRKDPTCMDKFKEKYYKTLSGSKLYMRRWYKKMHGAGIQPPPRMPLNVCVFILFAAFVTDFIMFSLNKNIKDLFGEGLGFEPGQVASATTMIYALTASPAAQPRSIILGHMISMCVGMTFAFVPGDDPNLGIGDPFDSPRDWFRLSGSVSVSTTLMAMAGVAHPPGGAISLIFLRYKWNEWISYKKFAIILLQDVILIALSAIFNNVHSAKSYPTYWGDLPNRIGTLLRRIVAKKDL